MVLRRTPRYTLAARRGGRWAAVERIRMRDGDAPEAVADVRAFLAETGTQVASWWLTERSTPAGLEEQLLALGVERVEGDYLHDGLLATAAPPSGPAEIEARAVATPEEYLAARRLQSDVFEEPMPEDARGFGQTSDVVYAAWLDGELVGAGRALFTRCGAYLMGGATLPRARGRGVYRALVRARWDDAAARGTPALAVGAGPMSGPILRRLGFEHVLQFRRLQSVPSTA